MTSRDVTNLADLVQLEKDAVARNDWTAFRATHRKLETLLGALIPAAEDAPSLQSLLSELDVISSQLATRHRITGTLLQSLGNSARRTGRVISSRY